MTSFTAGPWRTEFDFEHSQAIITAQDGDGWGSIAAVWPSNLLGNRHELPYEANANLIAAAPEMYEALEAVVHAFERNRGEISSKFKGVYLNACQVLAKADGQ